MVKIITQKSIKHFIKKSKPMLAPDIVLRDLISECGNGVYASSDNLFKGAVFGRDSLVVAEDLMAIRPYLVRKILLTLASLQGVRHRSANEEEPGKIIHEYRTKIVDGKHLTGQPLHIYNQLSRRWGGTESALIYYGSIDSTPHFVRTLGKYCQTYGSEILKKRLIRHDGSEATMQEILLAAVGWLEVKLADSKSGLIEYHAHNQKGIKNQAWKDSKEFYVHETGRFVNHQRPVASVEVQGLAYDALRVACDLIPERAPTYKYLAIKLRDNTIELLWQTTRNYFALGIDFDQKGKLRVIKTTTANPASLLNSHFFDDLDVEIEQKYVSGIVRNIMGVEFLTNAGIRSRALGEANLIPFWDYHGSFVSWPKETYDIAKGLNRQGFPELAKQLENRLLNVIRKSRSYPEFLYVDPRGRVLGSSSNTHRHTHSLFIRSTNKPESVQAWTLSAVIAILFDRRHKLRFNKVEQSPWQVDIEKEVLSNIPKVSRLKSLRKLTAQYPDYPYQLTKKHF